ncbi:hypothetical protein GQ53DRAFT_848578 [Thozetella sp. PMI_491]|nr:hypothetical protein GQ53DRAFT_848578 [Thozetella sp. PMI_491]
MPQLRASRACISCRTRKVRCTGEQPCPECVHLGIGCNFGPPRASSAASRAQSKRGSVISDIRSASCQDTSRPRLLSAKVPGRHRSTFTADESFFLGLLPDYESYVYNACPLLSAKAIRESIAKRDAEAEHAALCYGYAAATYAVACTNENEQSTAVVFELISRALEIRPILNHHSQVDLYRIVLSVFLRIAFGVLQDHQMEDFYHRETVSMLQISGIDQGKRVASTELDGEVSQRLHWVVFIRDRLFAVAQDRMGLLAAPSQPPFRLEGSSDKTQIGFSRACELYRRIDDDFLALWRDKDGSPRLTEEWIIAKQEELEQQRRLVDEACPNLAPIQRADLILTYQWLRLLVWQMATRKYLLRSNALQSYMLLYFPAQESARLQGLIGEVEHESLGRCGMGVFRKLFEVVDVSSDVLTICTELQWLEDREIVDRWLVSTCHLISRLQRSGKMSTVQDLILQQKLTTLHSRLSYMSPLQEKPGPMRQQDE